MEEVLEPTCVFIAVLFFVGITHIFLPYDTKERALDEVEGALDEVEGEY